MKRATISEAKNGLSALLHYVRRGGEVLIFDRDTPVARLLPFEHASAGDDARLDALERQGVVRRARSRSPAKLPPPLDIAGAELGDALRRNRDDARY
jgi:prevent-host-death family protein